MEYFSDENFKNKVEDSQGIILVDFYADWCRACKEMSEILEQIEKKYPQIKVGMLNTVEDKQTVKKYEIISLPTLIFFKNGMEQKRKMGVLEKEEIEKTLLEVLK